ncbi:hypothetical protein ACFQ3L_05545 [Lacticaseibacillus jixianensis]|uniref:Uncharacterized protein n=1 Tax=Lacticaseibacillus jixianensis TaxID=2486012 RepID=A0ABW4B8M0_9LACO|nr:hypothetical protein [Lacticaseibacillus jixianensis]
MRNNIVYVHYEPLANMFKTAGLSASDVLNASPASFRHLLLLPPVDEDEFIDPHTGLNEISGEAAVTTFLRSKGARTRSWLDYKHASYLRDLLPTEVAELLYLGFAKTHITPPFYYKLQNELVFLPLKDGQVTMYFRTLERFSATLAVGMVRHLRLAANDQPFWLRLRAQHFPPVTTKVLARLYPLFEDGVLMDFSRTSFSRDEVAVPLYRVKRRFVFAQPLDQDGLAGVGTVRLQRATNQWHLRLKEVAE